MIICKSNVIVAKPFTYFCAVKKSIAFLLAVVCLISCEDDNTCGITDRSDEVFLQFYSYETKQLLAIDFDSVGVVFANEDVFYLDSISTDVLILPIDVSGSVTDFILFTDSVNYDFKLGYRNEILIENELCDPVFRVFALEASSVELDSFSIKVLELTKLISPHVEIYF